MHRSAGFTLIELTVAIAIAAILIVAGMPSFQQLIARTSVNSDAQQLATAMRLARQTAIELNTNTKVCALKTRTDVLTVATCNGNAWKNGWGVFRNDGGTWKLVSEFPALAQTSVTIQDENGNDITSQTTQEAIDFSAIGTLTAAAEISFFLLERNDCTVTVSLETLAGLVETSDAVCT